jgi:hypothetical protein
MKVLLCCAAMCLLCAGTCVGDEIKGTITVIDADAGTLEISGVKVIAGKAPVKGLPGGKLMLSDFTVGDRVEIDGVFTGPGEFSAARVEREDFERDAVEGHLEKVDVAARILSISGITVKVPATARISPENKSRTIKLEKLIVGLPVECAGTWTAPRELTAEIVELE